MCFLIVSWSPRPGHYPIVENTKDLLTRKESYPQNLNRIIILSPSHRFLVSTGSIVRHNRVLCPLVSVEIIFMSGS